MDTVSPTPAISTDQHARRVADLRAVLLRHLPADVAAVVWSILEGLDIAAELVGESERRLPGDDAESRHARALYERAVAVDVLRQYEEQLQRLTLPCLDDVVRGVFCAPYAGPRVTDEVLVARLAECELCGVVDFEPLARMAHTVNGGLIDAHHECGLSRGYVLDVRVPADPAVIVPGDHFPAGSSARLSSVGAGVGSALPGGHPVGARSGVDAAPVPSQRRPGRGALPAAEDATVDPDDVSECPVALFCESCSVPGTAGDLDVVTAESPVGVFCLTLCPACVDAGSLPRLASFSRAAARVCEHAGHLGVTVDVLAAARP